MLDSPERFSSSGSVGVEDREAGLVLLRLCLPGVAWRGQLCPWQGMCLQLGAPFRALPTLGVMAPVKPALPFAMCLSLCSPFAGRAPEGTWGLPAAGTSASPGDTAGGDSHALLCQKRGPQALPCFAGCCDRLPALTTRFSLGSGGGEAGGAVGQWPISPAVRTAQSMGSFAAASEVPASP